MKKGTKIALIALAVLSLVCLAGLWSVVTNATDRLEEARLEAAQEGNEILILLASDWSVESVELRTAKDYSPNSADFERWRIDFGGLVSGDLKLVDFQIGPDLLTAKLECTAEFDEGRGDVEMTLTREPSNSWMLAGFGLKPAE